MIILNEENRQFSGPVLRIVSDNWGLIGVVFAILISIKERKYAGNLPHRVFLGSFPRSPNYRAPLERANFLCEESRTVSENDEKASL